MAKRKESASWKGKKRSIYVYHTVMHSLHFSSRCACVVRFRAFIHLYLLRYKLGPTIRIEDADSKTVITLKKRKITDAEPVKVGYRYAVNLKRTNSKIYQATCTVRTLGTVSITLLHQIIFCVHTVHNNITI